MLQKIEGLPSSEAKYMAFNESLKEIIYLNKMVRFCYKRKSIPLPQDIPLLPTGSQSAMKLAHNPQFHKKTKHITIQYHYIRGNIKDKDIKLEYINT